MPNQFSLKGFVGSDIKTVTYDSGVVRGRFRVGSDGGHFDQATKQWVDGATSWFSVIVWGAFATNAVVSLHKGDRVVLVGRLRVEEFTYKDGTKGTDVVIDADSIGPDLKYGTASFHRTSSARSDAQGGNWQGANVSHLREDRGRDHEEGEIPDDDAENGVDPHDLDEDSGSADGDLGGQAAALEASANGLREGEGVNEDTGEIVEESVPF